MRSLPKVCKAIMKPGVKFDIVSYLRVRKEDGIRYLDYLEDTEAAALYGRITGTNEWQDVTVPANLKALDHAAEQGNYAEGQGDYPRDQGDYAKEQGAFASSQTETALLAIRQAMLKIEGEFGGIKDIINSTENGELFLEVNKLLNDMYRQASDTDVDRIIAGTYVDEDYEGSLFESGTDQDIDDIIAGTYTDAEDSAGDTEAGTLQAVANIADNAFKEG